MAGADFAGVDLVVVEVFAAQGAVLVTDQAIFGDDRGIEFELDLHVLRDGQHRRRQFLDEHLAAFVERIDIGMVAVADVGQLFGHRIVVVAGAEAQRRQRDAGLALVGDHRFQRLLIVRADVEIAVGGEDHAVDAVAQEAGFRLRIGQLQALAAIGRAAGFEPVQRGENRFLVGPRGRRQDEAGAAGVDDHRHAVLRPQLLDQFAEAGFQQGQLVLVLHGPGGVDQEDDVRGGDLRLRHGITLDADLQQLVFRIPRRRRDLGADAERRRAIARRGVTVVEIIDHLFGAHGVGRRTLSGHEHAAHIAVAAGIDVDRKGADRILGHAMGRIVLEFFVLLGIGFLPAPRELFAREEGG